MKYVTLLAIFITFNSYAQDNFQWDVRDSIDLSKNELYSLTKQFIAYSWKNPDIVIKNDDKEAGVIIVRGVWTKDIVYMFATFHFKYSYVFTFMVKDGKYRLKVEDVICEDAILKKDYSSIKCIPPYEGDNHVKSTMFSTMPTKKQQNQMMYELKLTINSAVDAYLKHMASKNNTSDDW